MAKLPSSTPAQAASSPTAKKPRQPAGTRKAASPRTAAGYKTLGQRLRAENKLGEARQAFQKAVELAPHDMQALLHLGFAELSDGDHFTARLRFEKVLEADPDDPDAHQGMGTMCYVAGLNTSALQHIEKTLAKKPQHKPALMTKTQLLTRMSRVEEAAELVQRMIKEDPENAVTHWNDLGNIHRTTGNLVEAEKCYSTAATFTKEDPAPLSNRLTLMHYMPERTAEQIVQACKEWGQHFKPADTVKRPVPADLSPNRVLRVGMFSDGFRQHPVGAMTTSALEHLARMGVELYLYTTHGAVDDITERLMAIAKRWTNIANLRDEPLAQRFREDQIDILMDLSGHNSGNRTRTMVLEPAPILMKWVGGLINTTGVEAIDYLLTDSIESPPGSDDSYTEKLIRMPDDYICYVLPQRLPDVNRLPAQENGYVTFGCFNNPAKINDVLLAEWAALMHAVPNSRLYLKGGSFGTAATRERILGCLQRHGIDAGRIRIEGQVSQYVLLEAYNEVDVALDPWPYSGGLTTCEAMLMGVPVVTLPGPTFAGRHSATHLINAGMPELVTENWDQYRARVQDLVGNLESLATIRSQLRRILLESPVCDGARFATNLANALRATWHRYCDGKAPAALAFTPEGQPWFEDEDGPIALEHPPFDAPAVAASAFNFSFEGQIVTLDHGSALAGSDRYKDLKALGSLETLVFDPTSQFQQGHAMQARGEIRYFPGFTLGDGSPAKLNACLEPAYSGTLKPLPADQLATLAQPGAHVLAALPVTTTRLDAIDGLTRVDWLVLDANHDTLGILAGAQGLLPETLVVEAGIRFPSIYHDQPGVAEIGHTLAPHGFKLLRLAEAKYHGYFPDTTAYADRIGSQLLSAVAVFVPDERRMKLLDDNRRRKLAFILDAGYGSVDYAYDTLRPLGDEEAAGYLEERESDRLHAVVKPQPEAAPPVQAAEAEQKHAGAMVVPDVPHMEDKGRAMLEKHLAGASIFLEYGSGGSSVLAAKTGVKRIYSVDSDRQFLDAVARKIAESGGDAQKYWSIYSDIGKTREWGHPTGTEKANLWPRYISAPWDVMDENKQAPDLILIDGRFRVACFLACALLAPAGCTILFDDYFDRPGYHVAEKFLKTTGRGGRMAEFTVTAERAPGLVTALLKYSTIPS